MLTENKAKRKKKTGTLNESNPPKRGGEREKEKKEIDISKTAYATPKSKFNLGIRL